MKMKRRMAERKKKKKRKMAEREEKKEEKKKKLRIHKLILHSRSASINLGPYHTT